MDLELTRFLIETLMTIYYFATFRGAISLCLGDIKTTLRGDDKASQLSDGNMPLQLSIRFIIFT